MARPNLSIIFLNEPNSSIPHPGLSWLKAEGIQVEYLYVCDTPAPSSENNVTFIQHRRPGYGGALRDALTAAKGDYIVSLEHADTASTDVLKALWSARDKADIVSISSSATNDTGHSFLNSILDLPVRNWGSPYRIYRRKSLLTRSCQSEDHSILPELLVRAYADGFSLAEISPPTGAESALVNLNKYRSYSPSTIYRLWVLRNSVESADYDERAHRSRIPLQRYWQRKRHNLIAGYLEPIETQTGAAPLQILDIGCGSSRIIQGLDRAVAFDYAFRKLRYLKKTNKFRVWGSTFSLPFPDGSFKQIIHSQVVEHIPYEPAIYLELNRVLEDQGTLVIGTPDYGRIWWPIIEYFYGKVLPNAYADEHITHYTRETLIDILAEFGFRTVGYSYICGGELIIKARKLGPAPQDAAQKAPRPRIRPPLG